MRKNKTLKTFLAVAVLALVSLIVCQFSPRPLWNVSHDQWMWQKTRIFSPRQNLDYAVIGPSHAWRGIDPNIISEKMNGATAWNLGRPWNGRDVDYFVLKELLERHDVKNVLISFVNRERETGHPYGPQIVSPSDAFAELAFFLKNTRMTDKDEVKERISVIAAYFANLSVRAYLCLLKGKEEPPPEYQKASDRANGYNVFTKESAWKENAGTPGKTWKFKLDKDVPMPPGSRVDYYLKRINRLCAEHDVKISFVFMPFYRHQLPGRKRVEYLSRLGEVLLPDIRELVDRKYWYDSTHLNQKGGILFTRKLVILLKKGKEASPYFKKFYAK